jgi:hypothetical protein
MGLVDLKFGSAYARLVARSGQPMFYRVTPLFVYDNLSMRNLG